MNDERIILILTTIAAALGVGVTSYILWLYIGKILCIKHNRVVLDNKVVYFTELWDMEKKTVE